MKIAGWIVLVLGILSLVGSLVGGTSVVGPLFWTGLGAYLVHRGKTKEREQKEKEDRNRKGGQEDGRGQA